MILQAPPSQRHLPLSAAQYGIWLGQELDRSNPDYMTAEVVELVGELNQPIFAAAVQAVVAHSATLHMQFVQARGHVWQVPAPHSWELQVLDFSERANAAVVAETWIAEL